MSIEPADVSSPVIVQRWTRFGHDRAYVKIGNQDLGYRDLKTGAVQCVHDEVADTVARATEDLLQRVRTQAVETGPCSERGAALPTTEADRPGGSLRPDRPRRSAPVEPDRDLALNRPGQAVRQIALELRDAAPVRTFLARVVGAKTDERAHRIGADGEVEVARRLARLGPQWRTLHAVPVGDRGSDIDHVVIGPAGVFTINTKNHPQANVWVGGDTIKVNGFDQPYVRNSRHEAQRAAKLLSAAAGVSVQVRGIVAIMGAHRGLVIKQQPRDGAVTVVARKQVDAHLCDLLTVLDQESVERIYEAARHLATWQPRTVRREGFHEAR